MRLDVPSVDIRAGAVVERAVGKLEVKVSIPGEDFFFWLPALLSRLPRRRCGASVSGRRTQELYASWRRLQSRLTTRQRWRTLSKLTSLALCDEVKHLCLATSGWLRLAGALKIAWLTWHDEGSDRECGPQCAFTALRSFDVLPSVSTPCGKSVSRYWTFVDLLYLIWMFFMPDFYMNPPLISQKNDLYKNDAFSGFEPVT